MRYSRELIPKKGRISKYHWLSDLTASSQPQPVNPVSGTFTFPLRPAASFSANMVVRAAKWPDPALTFD
jgi:hypothetical protein